MKYLLVCIPFLLLSCEKNPNKSNSTEGILPTKEDQKTTGLVNQLPTTGFKDPPWTSHICHLCLSKDFGCYPKSTSKGIRTKAGLKCIHTWTRVTKEEFSAHKIEDQVLYEVSDGEIIKSDDTSPVNRNQ